MKSRVPYIVICRAGVVGNERVERSRLNEKLKELL
eukprot:COSAG03_NODE_1783_length_3529_cov_1.786297_4_plen_35_part_00